MSCLCNTQVSIEITNQLASLHSTLAKLEACLDVIAAKVDKIDVYDDDWDGSDEEQGMDYESDEEPAEEGSQNVAA